MVSTPGLLRFPGALDDLDSLMRVTNKAVTKLTSSISGGATTIPVISTLGFPPSGAITIENEIVFYTGTTGNSFTGCLRGQDTSLVAAHVSGAEVNNRIIALHHMVLASAVVEIEARVSQNQWFSSVKAFGAVGDGFNDDTTAIQNAINQWSGTSGPGIIYFPKGTYKITSALVIPFCQNKTLMGDGHYHSVIVQATNNTPMITVPNQDTHSCRIKGLGFEYATQQTSSHPNSFALNFVASGADGYYWWIVEECRFDKCYVGMGVSGSGVGLIWGSHVSNCLFHWTKHTALQLGSPVLSGMPTNRISDIQIINTGGGPVANGPAIYVGACDLVGHNVGIEGWTDEAITTVGGGYCLFHGLHIESHALVTADHRVLLAQNGTFEVNGATVSVVNNMTGGYGRIMAAFASANVTLRNMELYCVDGGHGGGSIEFAELDTTCWLSIFSCRDNLGVAVFPPDVNEPASMTARIRQYDNNFFAGITTASIAMRGGGMTWSSSGNTYGIDMNGASFTLAGMRLGNNMPIKSRNAANSADLALLSLDASNVAQLYAGATISVTGLTTLPSLGVTGNVGFYGTTPISKPSSTTDLRQALINLGLYTSGGATPLGLNGGVLTAANVAATPTPGFVATPGLFPANLTAVTALATNTSQAQYLCRAQSAVTSVTVVCETVAPTATGITWAEVAIFKGSPVPNGNASLTMVGFTSVATTFNSQGRKATVVGVTNVSAGDDLWVMYGSQATTPFQLRGLLADDIQSGVFQTFGGKPSTAASPQATVLAGAAVVPAWIVAKIG